MECDTDASDEDVLFEVLSSYLNCSVVFHSKKIVILSFFSVQICFDECTIFRFHVRQNSPPWDFKLQQCPLMSYKCQTPLDS